MTTQKAFAFYTIILPEKEKIMKNQKGKIFFF